jgi:hypothetical protein
MILALKPRGDNRLTKLIREGVKRVIIFNLWAMV